MKEIRLENIDFDEEEDIFKNEKCSSTCFEPINPLIGELL